MKNRILLTPYFLDEYSADLEKLIQPDWVLVHRDLPAGGKLERMSLLLPGLTREVGAAVLSGERPVSIAGDCCTAIAVLAGMQGAGLEPTLVWLDAHGDFNTWETTPSGFLGGMPLAMLVGRGEQTLVEAVGLSPYPEEKIMLCDGRDLDPGERQALAASQVTLIPDITQIPDHPLAQDLLYIHFDTDIIDPREAPAMGYLAPGGPSAEQVRETFRRLRQTGRVVGVSLSAWRSDLDVDGRTRDLCMSLLNELIAV